MEETRRAVHEVVANLWQLPVHKHLIVTLFLWGFFFEKEHPEVRWVSLFSPSLQSPREANRGDPLSGADPFNSLLRRPLRRRSEEGIGWIGVRLRWRSEGGSAFGVE